MKPSWKLKIALCIFIGVSALSLAAMECSLCGMEVKKGSKIAFESKREGKEVRFSGTANTLRLTRLSRPWGRGPRSRAAATVGCLFVGCLS